MSHYKSGVLFTVMGALLWGISGTSGQFLLQQRGLTSGWLVAVRMLMAGLILLMLCYKKEKEAIFRVWKDKRDRRDLFLFAALGLSFCQYTYFATISHSNAGTATVLQFLAPVLIMIYLSVKNRKLPRPAELTAITFAVAGIFLLATHGRFDSLAISQEALIYGLLSAVSVVIYNLQPARLIKTYGTLLSLGWGMLIGGILLSLVYQPWRIIGTWDLAAFAALLVIIIFDRNIPRPADAFRTSALVLVIEASRRFWLVIAFCRPETSLRSFWSLAICLEAEPKALPRLPLILPPSSKTT